VKAIRLRRAGIHVGVFHSHATAHCLPKNKRWGSGADDDVKAVTVYKLPDYAGRTGGVPEPVAGDIVEDQRLGGITV
jgi:hypothetical protein